MKVLFIASGNSSQGISPIVKNQAESLQKAGVEVNLFPVTGKGFFGYLRNIFSLKKHLSVNNYDIIHAHYGLSAITATLATKKRLVVSLMGSDVKEGGWLLFIIRFFMHKWWGATIVKSAEMAKIIGNKRSYIIPNGVDIGVFEPLDNLIAKEKLKLEKDLKYILFASNPDRHEKNYKLAISAFEYIGDKRLQLLHLHEIPHKSVPLYINASDVILLTSLWEGSPNVIKEAMACCKPVVATDVGDVRWLFGDTEGCFITSYKPEDVAEKIKMALEFSEKVGRTKGRKRIIKLGLDSETIAKRIISVYKRVLQKD